MMKTLGALGLLLVAVYLLRGGNPADLARMIADMLGAVLGWLVGIGASIPTPTTTGGAS